MRPSRESADLSLLEDLDPDPPAPRRVRLDWLLGLILLLGVLGYAGVDWARQEQQQGAYQAGVRAVALYQWEAAQAAFAAAGDYRDAPARAQAAAASIATRDQQYAAAQTALAGQHTLGALGALQAVDAVQPGYRDTTRLLALLRPQVYQGALDGAVALRPQASPPGLYIYNATGWQWLRDSDAASRVVGSAPGYVLYDSPVREAPGPPRRHLIRATLTGGRPTIDRFALDPAQFSSYRVGAAGVWGILGPNTLPGELGAVQGYNVFGLVYQIVSNPRLTPLSLPNSSWVVLDMAADGQDYLLADLTDAIRPTDPRSDLYRANAYGGPRHLLYTAPGLIPHAEYSPDGRSVLLVSVRPGASPGAEINAVLMLDLAGNAAPRVLLEQQINRGIPAERAVVHPLTATFLTQSPRAGQVLILAQDGTQGTLSLLDPARPGLPQPLATQPGSDALVLVRESASNGGLVIIWQWGYTSRLGGQMLYVDAANQAVPLAWPPDLRVSAGWAVADRLLYLSATPSRDAPLAGLQLQSLPLAGLSPAPGATPGAGGAAPISLAAGTRLYNTRLGGTRGPNAAWPFHLGPTFLATLEADGLHAHSYDGTQDSWLESGITTLFPLTTATAPMTVHILR